MAEVHGKTDVYRIVYAGSDGPQQAIVFREPVEGTVFKENQVWLLPGAVAAPTNEQGEIPQIETGEKGVSWSWQK